jgi:hypothetical protein
MASADQLRAAIEAHIAAVGAAEAARWRLSTPPTARCSAASPTRPISDGVAGELRRRLFHAVWVQGLHLSSASEVRRLITGVMWPQEDITDRLSSPDIPSLLLRDPDLARIVRRSGGTIAPDGGPLTTAGWRRIRQWRQEWLALPSQAIPAVIGADQIVRPGIEGLRYLDDQFQGV